MEEASQNQAMSLAFLERTAPKNRIQASDFRVSTVDWPRASLANSDRLGPQKQRGEPQPNAPANQ